MASAFTKAGVSGGNLAVGARLNLSSLGKIRIERSTQVTPIDANP
jgi:hypothetical protein